MPDDKPAGAISIVWTGLEEQPVQMMNMTLIQINAGGGPTPKPDEFVLTVGYAAPPVLLGTQEEQTVSLAALGAVPAKTLGRFALTRSRVEELITTLTQAVKVWDEKAAQ